MDHLILNNGSDSAALAEVALKALREARMSKTSRSGSIFVSDGQTDADGIDLGTGTLINGVDGGVQPWVGDTTPPGKPTGLSVSSKNAAVVVNWDGSMEGGKPLDWGHLQLLATDDKGNDYDFGVLYGAGSQQLADLTPGSKLTIWAIGYDDAHDAQGKSTPNASTPSDKLTVTVESAVSAEELQAIQSDLSKAKSDIAAAESSMTDLTKTVSSVDGKATTSGSAPTADDATGKPEGAMWYVMDSSGNITATYILKSGSWVKYAWASSSIADEVNHAISDAASAASTAQSTADAAKSAAETNTNDLTSFINKTTDNLSSLQSQVDGSITTWFYGVAPTASNKPAVDWTTTDMKNNHLGDLYYDTITGYCYRYQVANNTYSWARISDVDVTKALSDAAKAQDTADAKRRVFTGTPSTPYDVGDLWVQGSSGDILTCSTAKTSSQSYNASDWKLASKYTDDTLAGQAHQAAVTAQGAADTAQTAADNAKALASTAQSTADTAKTAANLALANAQNMVMNTGNNLDNISTNNGVTAENGVYTRTFPGNENHVDFLLGSLSGKAILGHTYSISLDARVDSGNYVSDDYFNFGWTDGWYNVAARRLSGDWQRFAGKTTVGGNGTDAPHFFMSSYMNSDGAKVVQFRNLGIKDITEADAAQKAADAAQSTANTAKTIAGAAQDAADAANSSAKDAQDAANAAQETADGKNKVVRSTSAPSSTSGYSNGDQWWVYSGGTVTALYLFSGTAWVSQTLTNSVIANLDAGKITSGYVDADRIQAGSITGAKVAAGTITASNMVAGTLTAASGIIANAAIGSAQIIDGSIGSAEIADAAVGTAKIADAAISTAKIADASITNAKIASLDAGKITSGYVDAARIAANSITADKLLVASTSDLCPNPFFDPSGPLLGKPHDWIPSSGGHGRLLDGRDHSMPDSGKITVQSGESYRITFEGIRVSGTLMLNGGLQTGGTGTGIVGWLGMSASVDDGPCKADTNWHLYHIDYTVPTFPNATVTYGLPYLQLDQAGSGGETSWLVGALHIYRRSDATLIADGSISTNKLVAEAVTGDKIAANTITAREIKSQSITTDNIMAGQFNGYVFTGAVFQSSTSANTGIKIDSTALRMWDSAHNQTVYLDGEGKNNVLTGSFQTAATGNRVMINAQSTATIIGSSTSLSGQAITFKDDDFARSPQIQGFFTNSDLGDAPRLALQSGWKTDHDPAATLYLQSWPRSQGATGNGITSRVQISANTDYAEPDSTKKSYASLDLEGIGGSGAYVGLESHAYGGSEAQTWVTATRNDGVTEVGIGADAFTQSLYLGGKLSGITNQQTFQANNWKAYSGTTAAGGTLNPVTVTLTPAKYGVYYAVANADCNWGSIFMHVLNTGNASQYQVMGYNAGNVAYNGGIWVDAIAWLT